MGLFIILLNVSYKLVICLIFKRVQCFCGDSYGSKGIGLETDCSVLCPGNNKQSCGGGNRNSVYEIVP